MIVRPVDVAGAPLQAETDVYLEAVGTAGTDRKIAEDVPAGGIAEFETAPTCDYLVRVAAAGHRTVAKLVSGTETDVAIPMPIRPSAVTGFEWPDPPPEIPGIDFGSLLEDGGGPNGEHDGHGGMRVAALLNIWAKMNMTWLGVAPVASYVDAVLEVRVDRIICGMARGLLEALEAAEDLDTVPSGLHKPPAGYRHGPSKKTRDTFGNLQITTFISETDGGQLLADCDIDEHRRVFAHLFDVIEHHATRSKTNAVEVREILIAHQDIDPGWRPLIG